MFAETFSTTSQDALPDLGMLNVSAGSVHPNINMQSGSVTFSDTINNNKLAITPEYCFQTGFILSGSLSHQLTNSFVVGVLPSISSNKNELLVNAGLDLTNSQRLIITLSQLNQKLDLSSNLGISQGYITQNSEAFSYQNLLGGSLHSNVEVNGYISNTKGQGISDQSHLEETTTHLKILADPLLITGSHVVNLQARLSVKPIPSTMLMLGVGCERLKYKQLTGNSGITQFTGHAEWNQHFSKSFAFKAGYNLMPTENIYNIGLTRSYKGGHKIGLNFTTINNRSNRNFNDKQIKIKYRYNFGENNSSSSISFRESIKDQPNDSNPIPLLLDNIQRVSWPSSLQDQVAVRPSFISMQF
ncbi:MAG: hypothetical protein Q8L73_00215 [Methylotenera sp.]|nr:hypothetical protein [Methylotenera sp.]